MENPIWASIASQLEQLLERKLLEHLKKQNDPFSEYPETMSRSQAAKMLRLDSLQTLDNWAKDGRIQKHKIGKKVYFLKSELIAALKFNEKYRRT